MTTKPKGSRTGQTAYRQARERLFRRSRAAGAPCAFCKQPIDYALKYPDPDSFSADHVLPFSRGGADKIDNLVPAHLVCNKRRGAGPALAEKATAYGWHGTDGAWNPTSRAW